MAHQQIYKEPLNLKKHIMASPFKGEPYNDSVTQRNRLVLTGMYPVTNAYWGRTSFVAIFCKEHKRSELVPSGNYDYDLHNWYLIGLHPRFPIKASLLKAGWRYTELPWRSTEEPWLNRALKKVKTAKQFIKIAKRHCLVNLYNQGRRYRVTQEFKKKFQEESFTPGDFFRTTNQEHRRLIMRRGVPVEKVLDNLSFIREDAEGKIYRDVNGNNAEYLLVTCPSTQEKYLLQVRNTTEWRDGKVVEISIPEIRRRTFQLPPDAEFVQEA